MILLTRDAFLKAKEVGTKVFFENQSTETVIGGWTVVHLRDEDTTELIARYSKNIAVWSGAHIDRRLSSESRRLEARGGELAALGRMFENTCGQVPRLKLSKRVHVLAYQYKPVPVQEFCRAYMLILAANNIIVTYDPDGLPIAEELVGAPRPKR